ERPVARSHPTGERSIQRWWIGLIRQSEWTRYNESPCGVRTASKGVHAGEGLREGWLSCENTGRGTQVPRSGIECSCFDGERDRQSSRRSKTRNDRKTSARRTQSRTSQNSKGEPG